MKKTNGVLSDVYDEDLQLLASNPDEFWRDVTTIGWDAFAGCKRLKSIVIPEGVKKIRGRAFYDCESLESIVIPEGFTEIGQYAFDGCESLKSIVIPESVTEIGDGAFYGCESLESIVLPKGVTEIGTHTFAKCKSLKSIVIPEGVTEIRYSAFYDCESLKSIVIPEGVTEIRDSAFCGCKSLESIVIPEGFTEIGQYAFDGCKSLKSITIPEGVTAIGDRAFKTCESLESIVLPKSVKEIGTHTFAKCKSLKSIVIPEGVKEIGAEAFSDCESLKSIVLPEGVTEIGQYAFHGCKSLKSIDIPEGITWIGEGAFYGCESLKSIVIPESVKEIEEFAFSDCERLESVVISESVEDVGEGIFYECTNLASIDFCGVKISPEVVKEDGAEALRFVIKNKERKDELQKLDLAGVSRYMSDIGVGGDTLSIDDVQSWEFKQWSKIDQLIKTKNSEYDNVARRDLVRLARILGYFDAERTLEVKDAYGKTKKEKVCDRAFNFLQLFVKRVEPSNVHRFLQGMQNSGFSEEFLKFASNKTNYSELFEELDKNDDFLVSTYSWFLERDQLDLQRVSSDNPSLPTVEENRYKIKTIKATPEGVEREHWNQPTVELLSKEFLDRKFNHIVTARDQEIAEQFSKHTQYEQKHFDKAKEIDKEREQAGVPDFIVGKQIKNNRTEVYVRLLGTEKQAYFEETEALRDQILGEATDALRAQKDVSDKVFTYETLAKSDIANFYIGQLTSCCARLYGAGSGAMRAAILSPDMQPLVVRNDKDKIVAYSIMYINRQEGYAVLNDIEVDSHYNRDADLERNTLIYQAMKECAVKNIEEFNKTAAVKVKILTSGTSPNSPKINDVVAQNPTTQTFKAPDFNDWAYVGGGSWSGDWHGRQYLIWSADEDAAQKEGLCKK